MYMAGTLDDEFTNEIDKVLSENPKYIKANKEFHKFVYEEFSDKKTEQLDELLGILNGAVGKVYLTEGIKLGARLAIALLL